MLKTFPLPLSLAFVPHGERGRTALRRSLIAASALSVFAALASGQALAVERPVKVAPATEYTIQPEDILNISVVGESDLSRTITVLPDGKISYPYVGELKVLGLTAKQVEARIRAKVAVQLVRPEVTVTITRHADKEVIEYVSVLGAVKTPGKFALPKKNEPEWHLLNLLAESGGLTTLRPQWAAAMLVRNSETTSIDLLRLLTQADPKDNLSVLPGDILIVREIEQAKTQVQVLGEVTRPGAVPIPTDGSLAAVLASVGGPTPEAALSRATILRGGQNIAVNLQLLMAEGKEIPGLVLQPGDTLVVPTNKRQFAVFGAVTRPGSMVYPDDSLLTVLAALSLAGGQSANADLKNVVLVHPQPIGEKPKVTPINLWDAVKKGDFSQNIEIRPGDMIFIPETGKENRMQLSNFLSIIPSLIFAIR